MKNRQINLNYIRGLYDYLFSKTDEELENFDINSIDRQKELFFEMGKEFSKFGPKSKENIIHGINYIFNRIDDDEIWRNAIPHDLPINRVENRESFLVGMINSTNNEIDQSFNSDEVLLVDEIGPTGLDYSK